MDKYWNRARNLILKNSQPDKNTIVPSSIEEEMLAQLTVQLDNRQRLKDNSKVDVTLEKLIEINSFAKSIENLHRLEEYSIEVAISKIDSTMNLRQESETHLEDLLKTRSRRVSSINTVERIDLEKRAQSELNSSNNSRGHLSEISNQPSALKSDPEENEAANAMGSGVINNPNIFITPNAEIVALGNDDTAPARLNSNNNAPLNPPQIKVGSQNLILSSNDVSSYYDENRRSSHDVSIGLEAGTMAGSIKDLLSDDEANERMKQSAVAYMRKSKSELSLEEKMDILPPPPPIDDLQNGSSSGSGGALSLDHLKSDQENKSDEIPSFSFVIVPQEEQIELSDLIRVKSRNKLTSISTSEQALNANNSTSSPITTPSFEINDDEDDVEGKRKSTGPSDAPDSFRNSETGNSAQIANLAGLDRNSFSVNNETNSIITQASVMSSTVQEDSFDDGKLSGFFSFIQFAPNKNITKTEMVYILKSVVKAYEKKGTKVPLPKSLLRLKEIVDSWFAITNADELEGISLDDFKLLTCQFTDIIRYVKVLQQTSTPIDRNINVWDEIICGDKNVIIDDKRNVISISLNGIIERLTNVTPEEKHLKTSSSNHLRSRAGSDTGRAFASSQADDLALAQSMLASNSLIMPAGPHESIRPHLFSSVISTKPYTQIELAAAASDNVLLEEGSTFNSRSARLDDENFRNVFFVTYRHFITPELLFEKLVERYHVPKGYGIRNETQIKENVVELIRFWMDNYSSDFEPELLSKVVTFLHSLTDYDWDSIPHAVPEVTDVSAETEKLYTSMCMKMLNEIKLRDRKSKVNTYFYTFTGADLVFWAIRNVPGHKNVKRGVVFGQTLIEMGLIEHVEVGMPFIPSKSQYYQFVLLKEDLKEYACLNLVLYNPHFFNAFHVYTKSRNYDLYVKALCRLEYYRDLDPDRQVNEAKSIFDTFFSKTSKTRIQIDEKLTRGIESILRHNSVDVYLFDELRNKIYYEVSEKAFEPFKKTKECEDLIQMLYGNHNEYMLTPKGFNHRMVKCFLDYPDSRVPDSFFEAMNYIQNKMKINRELAPGIEFNDIDELEIARQLTIIASEYFCKIERSELLNQSWSKNQMKAPNLLDFIDRFNSESSFVSLSILTNARVKARARVMEKFIKIASHAKTLRNFSSMLAILSSLSSASVGRLKFTKSLISKQAAQMLIDLEAFSSSNNNYKAYRDNLSSPEYNTQPCIPHMAIFLQDLTFIEDGNPSKVKGLINFEQKVQMYNVISQVLNMQNHPFQLFKVMPLWHLLRRLPYCTEKQLYQLSLNCEPRGADPNSIT